MNSRVDLFRIWLWQKFIAYCTDSHAFESGEAKNHNHFGLGPWEALPQRPWSYSDDFDQKCPKSLEGGSSFFSLTSQKIKIPKWKLHHIKGDEILFLLVSNTEIFIPKLTLVWAIKCKFSLKMAKIAIGDSPFFLLSLWENYG